MEVFRVVSQMEKKIDDKNIIEQVDRKYAAETIYDVIANLQYFIPDSEELIAIIAEHPSITIL